MALNLSDLVEACPGFGTIAQTFARMEIAEEEISAARERYPARVRSRVDGAFGVICPRPEGVMPAEGWNQRYVAFAAERGRTPEEQVEADRREYPGGVMAGFIAWINDRWAEWSKLRGREARTAYDHEDFDRWLAERGSGCGTTR